VSNTPKDSLTIRRPKSNQFKPRLDSTFIPRRRLLFGSANAQVRQLDWWLSVSCLRLPMADIGARFAHRPLSTIPVFPKAVQPATASATEVEKDIPSGNVTLVRNNPNQLQLPMREVRPRRWAHLVAFDPRTGQPYRFNPETGQPCTGYPQTEL